MDTKIGFDLALAWSGTATELARRCEVTLSAVSQWRKEGVPANQAIRIERLSNGEIRAVDLCPEVETQKSVA